MKKRLIHAFLALLFVPTLFAATIHSIPGWQQNRLSMGSVYDGGAYAQTMFSKRPVDALFTYAGNNGAGDRGTLILNPPKTIRIMDQIRQLEKSTGKSIMPVMVFYTVDGSDGVWAIQQDLDIDSQNQTDNLWMHYVNLIRFAQALESYKDSNHPVPATILLNPDFIGEWHLQCGKYYCPIPFNQKVAIVPAIQTALKYLSDHGYLKSTPTIPSLFKNKEGNNTITDYIASVNWLIKTFAPDVPFGWQDNVWAGDPNGHLWVHLGENALKNSVKNETAFLEQYGGYGNNPYSADFLAFDKWERDVFDSGLDGAGMNNGYLYNVRDWDIYISYVSQISHNLGKVPVMLWQMPGGHLQINGDSDQRHDHGSTAPDYFFGDKNINNDLSNIESYIADTTFKFPEKYNVTSNKIIDYLKLCPYSGCPDNASTYNWYTNHLQNAINANVFAILWGGGSTTGDFGLSNKLDDNDWLYQKIQAYEKNNS